MSRTTGNHTQIKNKIAEYQRKVQNIRSRIGNLSGQIEEYSRCIQKVQEEIIQYQEQIRQLEQRIESLRQALEKVKDMKRKFDDNYRRRKGKAEAVLNYTRHPVIPMRYCNGMKALLSGKEFQRACRGFDNSQTIIKRRMEELSLIHISEPTRH